MARKLFLLLVMLALLSACAPTAQVTALPPTPTANVLTPTSTAQPKETPVPPTSTLPAPSNTPTPEPAPLTFAQAQLLFQYDASAPFDLKTTSSQVQDGMTVLDVTYAAADPHYATGNGGRIEAYIVTPPGKGPFAGILFVHGLGQGWGNRKEFLNEAVRLAHAGVVSVLPSGLFPWTVAHTGVARSDQMSVIKQVIELRRSLDLLLAQPGIDPLRIACVGHDYGAMHGALLAGVEKRVRAYALFAGDASYSDWAIQYFVAPANAAAYRQAMAAVDPLSYLPNAAPASLYFQFGKRDGFIPVDSANQTFAAASQPKKIDWYAADHTLNDQAVKDRDNWMAAQLGLKLAPAK